VDFTFKEVASMVRALQDSSPEGEHGFGHDAIYAVSEAPDSAHATLYAASGLYKRGTPVAIAGWDTDKFGYPGCRAYRSMLRGLWVADLDIVEIPPVDFEHGNTRTEALAFAKYAREAGWRSVAVVAPTVHQPRAFLTILKG